jgi:hypothetical protein
MISKTSLRLARRVTTTNPTIYLVSTKKAWPADRYSIHGKDRWEEHFEFDRASLELRGKTGKEKAQ